jgi:hypothetical protein
MIKQEETVGVKGVIEVLNPWRYMFQIQYFSNTMNKLNPVLRVNNH